MNIPRETSVIIKGYAALCVVIHHFWYSGLIVQGAKNQFLEQLGPASVVLFFTLSGYGLYFLYSAGKKPHAFRKLYVPYLFVTAVYCVIWYSGRCTADFLGPLFLCFLGINGDFFFELDIATMWYMTVLFFWYIVSGVIWMIKEINPKIKILVMFSIACFLHIQWGYYAPNVTQLVRWSAFGFPCGMLLAYVSQNCTNASKILNKRIIQLIVAVASLSIWFLYDVKYNIPIIYIA